MVGLHQSEAPKFNCIVVLFLPLLFFSVHMLVFAVCACYNTCDSSTSLCIIPRLELNVGLIISVISMPRFLWPWWSNSVYYFQCQKSVSLILHSNFHELRIPWPRNRSPGKPALVLDCYINYRIYSFELVATSYWIISPCHLSSSVSIHSIKQMLSGPRVKSNFWSCFF